MGNNKLLKMPKTKVAAKAVKESKKPKAVMNDKKKVEKKTKAITKKTAPAEGGMKDAHKRRNRAGTVALREIKRYQKSVEMIFARAPFQRLVRNITEDLNGGLRFASQAMVLSKKPLRPTSLVCLKTLICAQSTLSAKPYSRRTWSLPVEFAETETSITLTTSPSQVMKFSSNSPTPTTRMPTRFLETKLPACTERGIEYAGCGG